jgi:hypothetical protein
MLALTASRNYSIQKVQSQPVTSIFDWYERNAALAKRSPALIGRHLCSLKGAGDDSAFIHPHTDRRARSNEVLVAKARVPYESYLKNRESVLANQLRFQQHQMIPHHQMLQINGSEERKSSTSNFSPHSTNVVYRHGNRSLLQDEELLAVERYIRSLATRFPSQLS